MVEHACNPRTWKVEAKDHQRFKAFLSYRSLRPGPSKIQRIPQLQKFETKLGYVRPCLKISNQVNNKQNKKISI